ncbi:uncharacterized protein BO97DRAFT_63860 [Aspergillus homomorphus CBS 101889]|uniref:Uncharacterized protein n=1 Tax=Aspergillus homomorphus (strain CBS 101889) TaxID=1450537 RepID=A0A395HXV3_ASPHC|nr:hypothetical protein BO97DRAFT_63860 [Aspergillus homomorphus CBS 101889]RAL12265.1 hypothetical protein BO97DRAFT_63860 [Aspergillus homomorphus CBS 101889]
MTAIQESLGCLQMTSMKQPQKEKLCRTLEDLQLLSKKREENWKMETYADRHKKFTECLRRNRLSDKRKSLSSRVPTEAAMNAPFNNMRKTGGGSANGQQHMRPALEAQAKISSGHRRRRPEYHLRRQQISSREVTGDLVASTRPSEHILSCENDVKAMLGRLEASLPSPCDEVNSIDSCKAESYLTCAPLNEVDMSDNDQFVLSASNVDCAALEAACDAVLASELNPIHPIGLCGKGLNKMGTEPAAAEQTCYHYTENTNNTLRSAPTSDAGGDTDLSGHIKTRYHGKLFMDHEEMQTRAQGLAHIEGCLECRLRQSSDSQQCEPVRRQMEMGNNLEGFWQRRRLY